MVSIAELVEEIKTSTSKMDENKGQVFQNFHRQKGYAAFSVRRSEIAIVREYINNQKEHHRRVTFQEEYRNFLQDCEVPYDERCVWG